MIRGPIESERVKKRREEKLKLEEQFPWAPNIKAVKVGTLSSNTEIFNKMSFYMIVEPY